MTYKEAEKVFLKIKPSFNDDYKDLLRFYNKSKGKNVPHLRVAFITLLQAYLESKNLVRPGEL